MGQIAGKLLTAALCWTAMTGAVTAQPLPDAAAVHAAAMNYAGAVAWRPETVIASDFDCTGKVQQAILGLTAGEIVVAIFTHGLALPPETVRFDAGDRNVLAAKIRVDDYSLTAEEIAGVSGAAPVGYRPSGTCHGVRLSDDSSGAAHIYWDHDHRRFETWTQ